MIRAAICDDELLMPEQMHSIVQSTFLDNQLPCELSSFQSGTKLLVAHHQQPFDIIFLDILMPDCKSFIQFQWFCNQSKCCWFSCENYAERFVFISLAISCLLVTPIFAVPLTDLQ